MLVVWSVLRREAAREVVQTDADSRATQPARKPVRGTVRAEGRVAAPPSGEVMISMELVRPESPAAFAPEALLGLRSDVEGAAAWSTVPLEIRSAERATLPPTPVERARSYQLLAWHLDGHYYWCDVVQKDFETTEAVHLGNLHAQRPIAIRLSITNNTLGEPQYALRFERPGVGSGDTTSGLLMENVSPLLASSFDLNAPYIVAADSPNVLSPLYDDPQLSIQPFTIGGRGGQPMTVTLERGGTVNVALDIGNAFGAMTSASIHLRGQVVVASSDEPVTGALVERLHTPYSNQQTTGGDGSFRFDDLPAGQACWFRVTVPGELATSTTQPHYEYEVDPVAQNDRGEMKVTWRLPMQQVVRVALPERFQTALAPGFPKFRLQRFEPAGKLWRDASVAEVEMVEGRLVSTVQEPGIYRVVGAVSPLEVYTTADIEIGGGAVPEEVKWVLLPEPQDIEFVVTTEAGVPMQNVAVEISGPFGFEPMRLSTDDAGVLRLPQTHLPIYHLTVGEGVGSRTRSIKLEEMLGVREQRF